MVMNLVFAYRGASAQGLSQDYIQVQAWAAIISRLDWGNICCHAQSHGFWQAFEDPFLR